MAKELSTNWKKLQATLKHIPPSTHGRKRILPISDRHLIHLSAKRQKLVTSLNSKSSTKIDKNSGNSMEENLQKPLFTSIKLWAQENDISASDLAEAYGDNLDYSTTIPPDIVNKGLVKDVVIGKYIAIDCEMVGVGKNNTSVLARVSLVNFHGLQIYDSFVKQEKPVTNWRTEISGITPRHMKIARSFNSVRRAISSILEDKIVIGHGLIHDFRVLKLKHPRGDMRDTSTLPDLQKFSNNHSPSLKVLAKEILGVEIQSGQHSSIEDARATMLIFRRFKSSFEAEHAKSFPKRAAALKRLGQKKKPAKNTTQVSRTSLPRLNELI